MLELINLNKSFYDKNRKETKVLKNINLTFQNCGLYFISGKSGSGKSTLLNILGGILSPTSGELKVNGEVLKLEGKDELLEYRKNKVSFVFQDFNLIDDFTVSENIQLSGSTDEAQTRKILKEIGLESKINSRVCFLSGGEKQRLAIGRALAKNNNILLLDEPTGNLDSKNAKIILEMLKSISRTKLVIIVSHDQDSINQYGDHDFCIKDGEIFNSSNLNRITLLNQFIKKNSEIVFAVQEILINNDIEKVIIKSKDKEIEEIFQKENIFKQCKDLLNKFENQAIDIIFLRKENVSEIKEEKREISIPRFTLQKQIKYATKLFRKRLFRNLVSIFSFSLTIMLMIVQMSFLLYNFPQGIQKSFIDRGIEYSEVHKMVEGPGSLSTVKNGQAFYEEIKELNAQPILSRKINIDNVEDINLFFLEKPMKFNDLIVEVPALNTITTTSFLSSLLMKPSHVSVFLEPGSNDVDTLKANYLDEQYDEKIMKEYLSNKQNTQQKEIVDRKYKCAFVSKEFIINKYAEYTGFKTLIPSLFPTRDDSFISNNTRVNYEILNDSPLLVGRAPIKLNEVIVTNDYYEGYLREREPTIKEPKDIIGKTLYFKDIESEVGNILQKDFINLYRIAPELTIVGVSDVNNKSSIVFTKEYHQAYFQLRYYYEDNIMASTANIDTMKAFFEKEIHFNTEIYALFNVFKGLYNSELIYFLIGIELVFLLITIILISLSFTTNVREKLKEICVFKSLGINNRSIVNIFMILNAIIIVVSFIIGYLLSFAGIYFLNQAIINSAEGIIVANVLTTSYLGILIIIPIALLVGVIATIYPLIAIRKVDIAVALKSL